MWGWQQWKSRTTKSPLLRIHTRGKRNNTSRDAVCISNIFSEIKQESTGYNQLFHLPIFACLIESKNSLASLDEFSSEVKACTITLSFVSKSKSIMQMFLKMPFNVSLMVRTLLRKSKAICKIPLNSTKINKSFRVCPQHLRMFHSEASILKEKKIASNNKSERWNGASICGI